MKRAYGLERTQRASFALSPEEMAQVKENAAFFAMTVSDFLRHVALGGTIDWRDGALRKRAWAARKGKVS